MTDDFFSNAEKEIELSKGHKEKKTMAELLTLTSSTNKKTRDQA